MLALSPAPGKYCAGNAVDHLRKAATIAELDPAMAVFRGITAEEEAATAVFHAVRRRRYVGAQHLKPRDHLQKNALLPFCHAVARLFAEATEKLSLAPQLTIDGEGDQRRLDVWLNGEGLGLGKRRFAPVPPLHFSVSELPGPLLDFSEQMTAIATEAGSSTILSHLRQRANVRNQLLYASVEGMPAVSLHNFLELQEGRVRTLIIIYLLIDPYAEHQLFVSQALLAFLKMLERLPTDLDPFA